MFDNFILTSKQFQVNNNFQICYFEIYTYQKIEPCTVHADRMSKKLFCFDFYIKVYMNDRKEGTKVMIIIIRVISEKQTNSDALTFLLNHPSVNQLERFNHRDFEATMRACKDCK